MTAVYRLIADIRKYYINHPALSTDDWQALCNAATEDEAEQIADAFEAGKAAGPHGDRGKDYYIDTYVANDFWS